jgi:hypothetical protein
MIIANTWNILKISLWQNTSIKSYWFVNGEGSENENDKPI